MIGLAAWRLSAMLSYERGPFKAFIRFRELLGFEHDGEGKVATLPTWEGAELVSCVWCMGVWLAAVMFGVWQLESAVVKVIAAMAVVVMVEQWVKHD